MKNMDYGKAKIFAREYFLILLGSILYALSTVLFIFPNSLLLGGTSGISVILESFIPFSSGKILVAINYSLILFAFVILGKDMAVKTLVGSFLTTTFVGFFEKQLLGIGVIVANPYISAFIGATIIAVASGIMFYVDSSSGGTDIIALIIQKFFGIHIGKALLISDVLIVLVGGLMSGTTILLSSFLGLLIKTFGIDGVIACIKRLQQRGERLR